MRAAMLHRFGEPDDVTVQEVPDPVPGAGQVVVDVHAAAVNFADTLMLRGEYQIRPEPPFVPGSEFAGVVAEQGEGVDTPRPGDRVVGMSLVGGFAERALLDVGAATPVPDGVDLAEAAAFFTAYGTSYHALRSTAGVQSGDDLVVLGAAGGVGLAAVEIGSLLGARVVACASSEEKLALCRDHGAAETVDYSTTDLKARLKELTDGGADVVLDPVGGPYAEPALRATRYGGRFVTVGFAAGEIPRIPLNLVMLKGVIVKGFEIRAFMIHEPEHAARDRAELLEHLAAGRLRPHIGSRFPLVETGDALAEVAQRRARGKVIVDVRR